jgi:TatA/E family protein of Tat protein translocase
MLSIPHMLVVFVIVLVVFGPQKLPELARSLGKMLAEFRKASADFRGAFEEEMKDLERQAREVERKKAADAAAKAAAEAPVQEATLATPAGTETPDENALAATDGGAASSDANSEIIDTRATEGSGELVVTPVAESVSRSTPEIVEAVDEKVAQTASSPLRTDVPADVPHDQQPA